MLIDPMEHLAAELQRLDLLLHREILRLRATYQLSLDEFRGLYISDEQVNSLIDRSLGHDGAQSVVDELTRQAESVRQANAKRSHEDLPWRRLAAEFSLAPIEQDLLLLAIAPEIDLKYETLYAYLNNDVTRKWPTCDLALRLLSTHAAQQLHMRRYLMPESTLFASGLLQPIHPAPTRPVWLASGFSVSPSVPHYLLGFPCRDPRLAADVEHRTPAIDWPQVPIPAPLYAALRRVPTLFTPLRLERPAPVLILQGHDGTGRSLAAEALCRDLGLALLRVDLEAARASAEPWDKLVPAVLLQQRLHHAGVYLARGEAWFNKEGQPLPEAHLMLKSLARGPGPVFFTCEPGVHWRELVQGQRVVHFHFDDPDYAARLQVWEASLTQVHATIPTPELEALADRFVLTPGQITAAVLSAADAYDLLPAQPSHGLNSQLLFEAARAQSDQSLGHLAPKVKTIHTWDDLVLPRVTLQRVKEVAAAIKHRHIVYSEWGFAQRIASGTGLKVLFAGASGTGKTMTAGVLARDLGLDLYKIDLSGIVSKYIGETEKNLDRIFRAAHASNAILFFDEADALFGKRSEVKDAHDRYANIEVAYLLQKIEEHEGVVILASNLSKNIDDAFSRRMHYVVEFPLPDERHRELLWRGMFPPEVPLGAEVDVRFLAKQFPLAGGDIKNVALDAAFLAAQDGRVITMKQLVQALARQMMKQGRIPSATDFKQFHALIGQQD